MVVNNYGMYLHEPDRQFELLPVYHIDLMIYPIILGEKINT